MSGSTIDGVLAILARLVVGGIFIYASLDKIAYPADFSRIVKNFGILPPRFAEGFAFVLPWLEIILGIMLIIGLFIRPTAAAISFILMIFIMAIVYKSLTGTLENCGCFSTALNAEKRSPVVLVFRNLILIAACFYLYFSQESARFVKEG